MAFVPIRFDEGKVMELQGTNATTFTKHHLVKYSGGYLVAAADGDDEVEYLALETKTTTSAGELVKVLPIDDTIQFEALCSTTLVQATHVGNDYDLDDAYTIKLSATTDKVFHIDYIKDAANYIAVGRFNKPAIA